MSEHHANSTVKMGSERNFGLVFAAVFLIVGMWPMLRGDGPRWTVLVIAAIFIAIALLAPQVLRLPNRLWFKLGLLLGAIVAPIVMALVYLLAFVPIGMLMRATGKDPLDTNMAPEAASYWIERKEQPKSMKLQF